MNITDIFFNNGQLNWDAIGVISNFILVASLVWINWKYLKKLRVQTELMVKDRERNKFLEQVQDVLTPMINHLEREIKYIQNNNILWSKRGGVGEFGPRYDGEKAIKRLFNASSAVFKDVIHKDADLERKFISHDDFCEKLNELYAKIEGYVKTPELTERLKVLVTNFNESREEAYRLRAEAFDEPERIFGNDIINFRYPIERSPNTSDPCIDFWEEYRDELLKFRYTPQIKEFDKNIEGVLSQLKKLDEALLEKIEAIREDYRLKYNFTKYEIDPKLRKEEEW